MAEEEASNVVFEIALENYFKLKNDYESKSRKLVEEYKKRATELGVSISSATQKTIIPRCINCGRQVGTIFTLRNRTYIAKCGDYKSPCSLDIRIQRGLFNNAVKLREELIDDLREIEEKVIRLKMDLLFQYINEDSMVTEFDTLRKEHKQFADTIAQIDSEIIDREEGKMRAINTDERELVKMIEEIQAKMREYIGTNSQALLKEILSLYEDEVLPTVNRIRDNRYDNMRVEPVVHSGEILSSGFREEDKVPDFEAILIRAQDTLETNEMEIQEPIVNAYAVDKGKRRSVRKQTATPRQPRKPREVATPSSAQAITEVGVEVEPADEIEATEPAQATEPQEKTIEQELEELERELDAMESPSEP